MIADFFFVLFAVMAIGGATAMVFARNPVASLLYLVMAFFALSGIFVLLDAHFIAAVKLIVYAGAIMVLFLFVIMLLNLGQHRADATCAGPRVSHARHAVAGALFGLLLVMLRAGTPTSMAGGMGQATIDAMLESRGAVGAVAEPLFRSYLVPFEITSLLLLVAIVGAIVLARRRGTVSREWISNLYADTQRASVRHRGGRRAAAAQRDHHVHVHRADAQRREPDARRVLDDRWASTARSFVFFVMAVAAAEAAVGLAIIIAIFRHYELVDVDRFNLLKW